MKQKTIKKCADRGGEFDESIELFRKKRTYLCQNCDRELFEMEIGYEND